MASFASLVSSGEKPTPFGVFDADDHFQEDADGIILYIKRRLGDDVMSVELTSKQIWANFEEATLEFSKQINAHQAESYMSNIMGLSIGPEVTFVKNIDGKYVDSADRVLDIQDTFDSRFTTHNSTTVDGVQIASAPVTDKKIGPNGKQQLFPKETLEYLLRRVEPYANEANVGGVTDALRGYIELEQGVQDYNIYKNLIVPGPNGEKLKLVSFNPDTPDQLSLFNPKFGELAANISETKIKVNEVYHFSPQAAYRFFDTTSAINYLNNQFSFESFTPETVFYVLPVFEDLLRAGQLDISNRVRRSNFSYKIQGSNLRIFPRPTQSNPLNLFVKFTFPSDPYKTNLPYEDVSVAGVSNLSNVPFGPISYKGINSMCRQWIKQYCLALCKETLGLIRSKFSSVPIPGSDLQMNGADLISQGREEKTNLSSNLQETLDKLTYQKLLEADAAQSESMMAILKRIPIPEGKCIIIG